MNDTCELELHSQDEIEQRMLVAEDDEESVDGFAVVSASGFAVVSASGFAVV